MPAAAGHNARLVYLWEDAGYAAAPTDTTYKTFGADAKLSRADGSNDALRVYNPGDRQSSDILPRRFNGSWSAEFTLTNPWFLRAVIDEPTTSGTAAPYTHTFSGKTPSSIQITVGLETAGAHRILKGCVVRSAEFSVQLDNTVTVTIDGFYADEAVDETGTGPAQVKYEDTPMTFAQATLSRNGTALNLVQNFSVSLEASVDPVGEVGTRLAVDYVPKALTPSVSFTKIAEADVDETKRLYGGATSVQQRVDNTAPLTARFDNGLSGASLETLEISMSGAFPESFGMSGIGDPETELQENINEALASASATAENDTATPP